MNIKEIVEGMTAPQVAQVIKDNFNEVDKDKANKTDLNKSISDLASVVEANKTDLTEKIDNNKEDTDEKLSELGSKVLLRKKTIQNITSANSISTYLYDFVIGNKVIIDLTEIQGNTGKIGFAFRRNGEDNVNYQLKQFNANEISDSLHYEMIAEDKYDMVVVYYQYGLDFVSERIEINNYYDEIKNLETELNESKKNIESNTKEIQYIKGVQIFDVLVLKSDFEGSFYKINNNFKKGNYVYLELEELIRNKTIAIAFRKEGDQTDYQQGIFYKGEESVEKIIYKRELLDNYDTLAIWTEGEFEAYISLNYSPLFTTAVEFDKELSKVYDKINENKSLITNLQNSATLRTNTIENTSNAHTSKYFYDFVIGNKVTIDLTEIQGNTGKIGFAFRRNGEDNVNYQLKQFNANEISDSLHYEMIAEDKYDMVVVYYHQGLDFVSERIEINNYYNEIKKERFKYSTFSILGDSYSTFKGFTTPSTNAQWYPTNISGTQGFETGNDVTDVKQMWWYLFAEYFKCKLDVNNSYSGSPICYDGYGEGNADAKNYSLLTRSSAIGNAHIIIIEGGTNDAWAKAQIGEYKYKDWSEDDLVYFRPACAKMINDIQLKNIGSRIIFMLNNGLKEEINSSVETICNYYGIELLKLNNISKIANHPDVNGMREIFVQLSNFILKD